MRPIGETFEGVADPEATARFALGMTGANLGEGWLGPRGARVGPGVESSWGWGGSGSVAPAWRRGGPWPRHRRNAHTQRGRAAPAQPAPAAPQPPNAAAAFEALASKFDFGRYSTLRDLGGSAAALSCTLAAAHPHLRCASADLPALLPAARARVASEGLEGRVTAEAIDFFDAAPFPRSDAITLSMILHDCESARGPERWARALPGFRSGLVGPGALAGSRALRVRWVLLRQHPDSCCSRQGSL